jgi:hypothetical protein
MRGPYCWSISKVNLARITGPSFVPNFENQVGARARYHWWPGLIPCHVGKTFLAHLAQVQGGKLHSSRRTWSLAYIEKYRRIPFLPIGRELCKCLDQE